MNSNTKVIVKILFIKATCIAFLKDQKNKELHPTLQWIHDECDLVVDKLAPAEPKKKRSCIRRVDACINHIQSLEEDLDHSGSSEVPYDEGALHTVSVITQLLDDLSQIKNKTHLVQGLLTKAFQLEDLIPEPTQSDEYDIRNDARLYLDDIYQKIEEFT